VDPSTPQHLVDSKTEALRSSLKALAPKACIPANFALPERRPEKQVRPKMLVRELACVCRHAVRRHAGREGHGEKLVWCCMAVAAAVVVIFGGGSGAGEGL